MSNQDEVSIEKIKDLNLNENENNEEEEEELGVAKFIALADEELIYLGEQTRELLSMTHEQRIVLFQKSFKEDELFLESLPENKQNDVIENGLCKGMLKALMQYCWNANGYALMYKSGIVQKDELSRLMQCTDPSFTHKHFTNMVLALWMLTVTQFMVKRRTELQLQQKNLNEKESISIDQLLNDFVMHLFELRNLNGRVSANDNCASFVFNMALLYFLYQMALDRDIIKLKAIVLKAFFPIWFIVPSLDTSCLHNEPTDPATVDDSFQQMAVLSLRFFLNVQSTYVNGVLVGTQESMKNNENVAKADEDTEDAGAQQPDQ